jgi:hypothetical protein
MVQIKVGEEGGADLYAGPPFETPYSINMPASDADCWLLHRDLIIGARSLTPEILDRKQAIGRPYLQTLLELASMVKVRALPLLPPCFLPLCSGSTSGTSPLLRHRVPTIFSSTRCCA